MTEPPLLPAPPPAPAHDLPQPWRVRSSVVAALVLILLVVIAGAGIAGMLPKRELARTLAAEVETEAAAPPRVRIARARRAPASTTVALPGTIIAYQQAVLYARATGYVARWLKDLGEPVRANELIAVISAPDVEAQLHQAEADLLQARAQVGQAQANTHLAEVSLARLQALGPRLEPQQQIDAQQAALDVARATLALDEAQVASAQANVAHLQALVAFTQIRAPFAGTITRRSVQVGTLVTGGPGTGQELFQISQLDPVQLSLDLPQAQVVGVRVGAAAQVRVRELGQEPVAGTVTQVAHLLDPSTHTMQIVLTIPNHDHRLLPGMYAVASITVPAARPLLLVPSAALILGSQGSVVAILTRDDRIHLQPVTIDLDTGADVLVSSGLTPDDRVVLNPGENLAEGTSVAIIPDDDAAGSAPAGGDQHH